MGNSWDVDQPEALRNPYKLTKNKRLASYISHALDINFKVSFQKGSKEQQKNIEKILQPLDKTGFICYAHPV
jgi:hypothetical protein